MNQNKHLCYFYHELRGFDPPLHFIGTLAWNFKRQKELTTPFKTLAFCALFLNFLLKSIHQLALKFLPRTTRF